MLATVESWLLNIDLPSTRSQGTKEVRRGQVPKDTECISETSDYNPQSIGS